MKWPTNQNGVAETRMSLGRGEGRTSSPRYCIFFPVLLPSPKVPACISMLVGKNEIARKINTMKSSYFSLKKDGGKLISFSLIWWRNSLENY